MRTGVFTSCGPMRSTGLGPGWSNDSPDSRLLPCWNPLGWKTFAFPIPNPIGSARQLNQSERPGTPGFLTSMQPARHQGVLDTGPRNDGQSQAEKTPVPLVD